MPPLDDERRQRLARVLDNENTRGVRRFDPGPSRFRRTAMDTHDTMPAEYWGPSPDLVQHHRSLREQQLAASRTLAQTATRTAGRSRRQQHRLQMHGRAQAQEEEEQDDVQYRSVFKPQPGQEECCAAAKERRVAVANSEWALLDSLETALCNDEYDQRHKIKAKAAGQLRAVLDAQIEERRALEQKEADTAARFGQVLKHDADVQMERDAVKQRQQRDAREKLRHETLAMVHTAQQAKQEAVRAERQLEEKLLAEAKAQLRQQRLAAEAKAAALRKQMQETVAENAARQEARKQEEARQRQLDLELMWQRDRRAAQVERQRQQERAAVLAKSQLRAPEVYGQVQADQAIKRAQEKDLHQVREWQKEQQEQKKEQDARAKKERLRQELLQAREVALALKAKRAAEERAADIAYLQTAAAETRAVEEEEERVRSLLRAKAKDLQTVVRTQIKERGLTQADADVGMTDAERRLNHKLLQGAVKVVGPKPKQREAYW